MAPALVENPPAEDIALHLKKHSLNQGAYKDVGSTQKSFDADRELEGSTEHGKASYPNYLPVWDNETTR